MPNEMHPTQWECGLRHCDPAPLCTVYRDLVKAVPILEAFAYFVDGDECRTALRYDRMLRGVYNDGAPHWVPGDVYAKLTGETCGNCKIYPTTIAALLDLETAWALARPNGTREPT